MSARPVVGLTRRLSKLRAMSVRELTTRVEYRALLAVERRQHRQGSLAPPERLRTALKRPWQTGDWQSRLLDSRRTVQGRFLPGADDRVRMQALFETRFRDEREDLLRQAALARRHQFEFFGGEYAYGPTIDWLVDPVTGRRWPEVFHADVPVHAGDVGYGDVKHVWELSRQQYLIDLAKSHFLTGSAVDLDAMGDLTRSWIAGNPYATGVNWSCALEPAFRAFSWLWAYHLTAPALSRDFHLEWLTAFYDHGRFLARHLEHYSSPYNHLIGEASSLFALGLCFPEFAESADWVRRGQSVLESRLKEQFYADGGSVEQSTFYHHATVGFYLIAGLLGRVHRRELSADVWHAISQGLDFSMALTQPDGSIPAIGGADDGKPIRMEHLPFWDFRPYLAMGAVLFERPDLKTVAGRFYEDALWLLGPEGLTAFDRLPSVPPATRSIDLRASGYYVLRTDWSNDADFVCFDCGEQAAGMRTDAVPNSMHGHADCLSIVTWLGGKPVLVDSGLYAYNCGGPWEAHFRETAAHNTARVDGRDQARHLGKMAWSHSYRARLEGWMSAPDQTWVLGSHDGYAHSNDGVTHRRGVWLRSGGYVLVYDEFSGSGEHDLELNFQFAPGALTDIRDNVTRYNDFAEVAWTSNSPWTATARTGGTGPNEGWICPSLGRRVPAPRLTLHTRMRDSKVAVLTVLSDLNRIARDERPSSRGQRVITLTSSGKWTDIVTAPAVVSIPDLETTAPLAVARVPYTGPITADPLGGTITRLDEQRLRALSESRRERL